MKHINLVIALSIFIGLIGLTYMHEQVHVEINRAYGIESEVDWFAEFPNVVTIGDAPCPTDQCTLAHNINDAIGYHLQVFYLMFSVLLYAIIALLKYRIDASAFEAQVRKEIYKQ